MLKAVLLGVVHVSALHTKKDSSITCKRIDTEKPAAVAIHLGDSNSQHFLMQVSVLVL